MYKKIVVLTGAGISAESGINTFRDNDGLWENHAIEDVATPEGYQRDPQLVFDFYNARRQQLSLPEIKPNDAHQALAKLQKQFGGELLIVTQNVDNLHERAGAQVLHMHGELNSARCPRSGKQTTDFGHFGFDTLCDCCPLPQPLRPDIVWFGEIPLQMEKIEQALSQCDLFIAIGTSGEVYPAAGFVSLANQAGATTVEVNLAPSRNNDQFLLKKGGKASQSVPKLVEDILMGMALF
ncbi:Sir2 family NAD+-dependent deacetylase [Paraferrimonas sp. SM1919]|uniref:Sir2 family NAD+-dependent deacetylase n=1 Tax=Paraferrimonas sp. SM1919 TaxID=2662263 RepID=UPI0013D1721C|nr:Sir2 family NAD+-dependent deacetylase [Paraferrimonas sp. SM1919]